MNFLEQSIPHLAFWIGKNTNQNVVCYRGRVLYDPNTNRSGFDPEMPIDVFWMDIDPTYQQRARAEGRENDRVELSWHERKMAYGIQTHMDPQDPDQIVGQLHTCPERPIRFHYDRNQDRVVAYMHINNQPCVLHHIHLHLGDSAASSGLLNSMFFWRQFTPEWIELHGRRADHNTPEIERIIIS